MPVIKDFFRSPSTGNGISGRTVSLRKHSDASEIDTAVTDSDGMFTFTTDYVGPVYYMVDNGSGTYKRHSGKSQGQIGPIWPDAMIEMFSHFGKGVQAGLEVSADGLSMDVDVSAGAAILKDGIPYYLAAADTVTIAAADATNPRIDLVVLRVTRAGESTEGVVSLTSVAGTPAASPTAPSATASSTTDDLVLAEVLVDAGATTIASGKVTDRRTDAGQEVLTVPLSVSVIDGLTASVAELNILDGVTATAAELNALDGITASVTELNYTDGVTSAIQAQLDAKVDVAGDTITGLLTVQGQLTVDDDAVITGEVSALTGDFGNTTVTGTFATSGATNLGTASAATTVYGAASFLDNVTLGNSPSADTTTVNSHFKVTGGAFSVTVGAAAGTGGSVAATRMRGSDQTGEIQVVTGASGTTTGTLVSVTFANARPNSDYQVFFAASSINASDLNLNLTGRSTTGFDIRANVAPGTGETLQIQFLVIEV